MQVTEDSMTLAQEIASTLVQINRISFQHEPFIGLKRGEFIFLASLAIISGTDTNGIKASQLSKYLQVTSSAVTHNLNALEKAGYVERISDPSDRRIVLVRLTATGQQVMEAGNAVFLESLKGLLEFLGVRDSNELHRLLLKAMDYFKIKEKPR
jgi:DNA-binding MarR family transcriptional regulator